MTVAEKFLQDGNLLMESPKPCDLKIGDLVVFTNEYGVSFPNNVVIGFAKNEFYGKFIHISSSSPWFPVARESLTRQGSDGQRGFFEVVYSNGEKLNFQDTDGRLELVDT
mgnify:CR=1 FL=1